METEHFVTGDRPEPFLENFGTRFQSFTVLFPMADFLSDIPDLRLRAALSCPGNFMGLDPLLPCSVW